MNEENLRQGRILLVDDEIGSSCLLESVLNRLRFTCTRKLTDPTKILETYDEYQPDLIITDVHMPQLDGIQLVEQVRNYLPRDTCLPILVLTGSADRQIKRNALQAGATDILFKPFDPSEMQMRVRSLLLTRFQYLEIQDQNRGLEQRVIERTQELQEALDELKQSQLQVVQQERFRAFGEMAGGVVHDFNNALMSIIGYSELLLQDETLADDRVLLQHYVKTMNTAGRDAAHVVARLRDFYRPREESDVFSNVQINDLIEEVVPLTRPKWYDQALAGGRTIRLDLELEKVPALLGNAAELREVFMNLVFNAVDAMPEGGVITIRSKAAGDSIQLEVADTGTGMTEEVRQRCLEPFFTTKGVQGTGLGLSMSFGIIRRHEGQFEIDSKPGVGTTLRLTLPSYRVQKNGESEARLTMDRMLRVLVVDDEPAVRDVVAQYLQADGHRVTLAANGAEAMKKIVVEDFDVVITDQAMPGMNGMQLAETVRRFDALKPVILLTGFAYEPDEHPGAVNCVLKKPILSDDLRTALRAAMTRRPMARTAAMTAA